MKSEDKAKVQQALEALMSMELHLTEMRQRGNGHHQQVCKAITALRQLLEQPVQEPVFYWDRDCFFVRPERAKFLGLDVDAMQALYTTPPAQPAVPTQCWKCGDMDAVGHAKCDVPACGMKEQPADHCEDVLHMVPAAFVGLTADEMLEALVSVDPATKRLPIGFARFAQAIEAKLREKNGGGA